MRILVGESLVYILSPMIEECRLRRLDENRRASMLTTQLWVTVGTRATSVGGQVRSSPSTAFWRTRLAIIETGSEGRSGDRHERQ
jgi:hypothetical protein